MIVQVLGADIALLSGLHETGWIGSRCGSFGSSDQHIGTCPASNILVLSTHTTYAFQGVQQRACRGILVITGLSAHHG